MIFDSMLFQSSFIVHQGFKLFTFNKVLTLEILSSIEIWYSSNTLLFVFYQVGENNCCLGGISHLGVKILRNLLLFHEQQIRRERWEGLVVQVQD